MKTFHATLPALLIVAMFAGALAFPAVSAAEVHTTGVVDAVPGLNLLAAGYRALAGDGEDGGDELATVYDSPSGSRFVDANTYAADVMQAQLHSRLNRSSPVAAASFVNLNSLDESNPLGRLAASQVGSRLAQHGFTVLEARLRGGFAFRMDDGEFLLTRDAARLLQQELRAEAALVGSYLVTRDKIFISARVARLEDGAVLAAYEYFLPNTGVERQLAEPEMTYGVWEKHARREPVSSQGAAGRMGSLPPLVRMGGTDQVQPPTRTTGPARTAASQTSGAAADSVPQGFPDLSTPPQRTGPPYRVN